MVSGFVDCSFQALGLKFWGLGFSGLGALGVTGPERRSRRSVADLKDVGLGLVGISCNSAVSIPPCPRPCWRSRGILLKP